MYMSVKWEMDWVVVYSHHGNLYTSDNHMGHLQDWKGGLLIIMPG